MIAIEEIDKLRKENLSLITVVTGEDLGQYSQLKERMMERVGYDKDDLTYSYFDMAEVDYQDAEMDLESLPFFADQKVVIFDNLLDITTAKKSYLDDKELIREPVSFCHTMDWKVGLLKLIPALDAAVLENS